MSFDYIVIGAGSSGCAVATGLSSDRKCSVLLLEAGGTDDDSRIHVPAAFPQLFGTRFDWNYQTTPQPGLGGRRDRWPRGRVVGGSSSINAQVYQRGAPAVYDGWATAGCEGWSWADIRPYFLAAEDQARGPSEHHGVGGPLSVSDLRDPNELSRAFLEACVQVGLKRNEDFNGDTQEGCGLFQVTQRDGLRCSSATSFLRPVADRMNLTVELSAHVTRLVFESRRCVGAAFIRDGAESIVRAEKEVVLCGGAVNSPQVLMLSGVGPEQALRELGIEVIHNAPAVGRHLQDHVCAPVSHKCLRPITLVGASDPADYEAFKRKRMGRLTSNVAEAGGFLRLDRCSEIPELQLHFIPGWFAHQGEDGAFAEHGFTLAPTVVSPRSEGRVVLHSSNPLDPPLIDSQCLQDERDVQVLLEGIRWSRRILRAPAFDRYRGAERLPGEGVTSSEALREHVCRYATTLYHPVGTCRMGPTLEAVVDARLRVHGVRGLRVADASIMPRIVNANTNAASIMIGQKAADLVRADHAS